MISSVWLAHSVTPLLSKRRAPIPLEQSGVVLASTGCGPAHCIQSNANINLYEKNGSGLQNYMPLFELEIVDLTVAMLANHSLTLAHLSPAFSVTEKSRGALEIGARFEIYMSLSISIHTYWLWKSLINSKEYVS